MKETERLTQQNIAEGRFMPTEEKNIFERAIARLPHPSILSKISHKDLLEHSKIYLVKHDLCHKENQEEHLLIAEVKITLQTLLALLEEIDLTKIAETYFHLALLSIEENPNSVYTISEKVIIGEFVERGGFEPGIWGWHTKPDLLPQVLDSLKEKSEKKSLDRVIERYQTLRIQELLPPLHL